MGQSLELAQSVEVSEFGEIIRRQHQHQQVRDIVGERRLDRGNSVAREQKRRKPLRQREVSELLNIVVREVYRILRLCRGRAVSMGSYAQGLNVGKLTPATPRFSIEGILWPSRCRVYVQYSS